MLCRRHTYKAGYKMVANSATLAGYDSDLRGTAGQRDSGTVGMG